MHDGMPYGRIQGQGHEPIQGSRIENLQLREVDRQSPTGLIFTFCHASACLCTQSVILLWQICLSQTVCLSHSGIVSKRMHTSSRLFPPYGRGMIMVFRVLPP